MRARLDAIEQMKFRSAVREAEGKKQAAMARNEQMLYEQERQSVMQLNLRGSEHQPLDLTDDVDSSSTRSNADAKRRRC